MTKFMKENFGEGGERKRHSFVTIYYLCRNETGKLGSLVKFMN